MAADDSLKKTTYVNIREKKSEIKGEIDLLILKKGKLIQHYHEHNLIVKSGRRRLAQLAAGLNTSHITQIGLGSGANEADELDVDLENKSLFDFLGFDDFPAVEVDDTNAIFRFHIHENEANGLSIRELGLFCADGQMFSHRVRGGEIYKDGEIEIKGTWTIMF